jgi:hypothetical protein
MEPGRKAGAFLPGDVQTEGGYFLTGGAATAPLDWS